MASWLLLLACVNAAAAPQWPLCSVRNGVEGGPAIVIDGAPYAPILFVANNQFGRDEILLKELRDAAGAGIKLFGFNVRLDSQNAAEHEAAVIEAFCKANPDGYFMARVHLGPSGTWTEQHSGECITKAAPPEGAPPEKMKLHLASPSSASWRNETAALLRKRIREIVEGPHGNRFLGVTLEYLQTAEWFFPDTNDFMDYSDANLSAFREWLRKTYKRDKTLRKAWGQPEVTLDSAAFPSPADRDAPFWGPFRDPLKQRPAIDMARFQNELVAETIAYFAGVAKEATARRSLVGAYYGYTMELNNNGPRALVHSGHLGLGMLLACRDIDLLHAPFSYFERGLGQPVHFHAPVDSISLHGKIEICEEDLYTHLSEKPPGDLIAPGWNCRTTNAAETLSIVRRDFGAALMHRCGAWFFDLLSDGRWNEKLVWDAMPLLRRISAEARSETPFQPEIAFVVDENSPVFLSDTTYPILLQSMSFWRAELDRLGAPVGYYLQSDLPKIPASVRLLVLANPFALSKEELKAAKTFMDHGATVIWNYAPNFTGLDGLDPAGIEAATGIAVEAKFDDTPTKIKSALTDETVEIDPAPWRPRFVVTSKDCDPVAHYESTGEISAAARQLGKGVSLYTATPRLPVGLMREICRRAGVFLYSDRPGAISVMGPYLIVHTEEEAAHTFTWPYSCDAVQRLAPGRIISIPLKDDVRWTDKLPAKTTVIYRLVENAG